MEDFSNFITEELFFLDKKKNETQVIHERKESEPTNKKQEASHAARTYQLGVVSEATSPELEVLLEKIIEAIGVDKALVNRAESIDSSSKSWLVFSEKNGQIKAEESGDSKIIYCKSLTELNQNVNLKKELWGLLKNHFDI